MFIYEKYQSFSLHVKINLQCYILCIREHVGSIPDGVIGICHWRNTSGRAMSLGSTQPLTEISNGKMHPCTGTEALYKPYGW